MGDNLRQSGPSMAAIDGPAGPVVAGDHLRRDSPPGHIGLADRFSSDTGTDYFRTAFTDK